MGRPLPFSVIVISRNGDRWLRSLAAERKQ